MPRSALDRLAGPILVFLGVSTIASTALLVPIVTSRRAGEGVQRDKPGDNAVNDGTTMVRVGSHIYCLRMRSLFFNHVCRVFCCRWYRVQCVSAS